MSATRRTGQDLDDLIAEITIDCHDEDEQLQAFENAIDEDAHFPCHGIVVGHDVEVVRAGTTADRRELIATCQRDGRSYEIALLDVDLNADPATSRLLAAYRRWNGN